MKKEFARPKGSLYVTITFERKNDLIYVEWDGFLTTNQIKHGSEELLLMLKDVGCNKVLVDNRKVSGPWNEVNKWYESDWNPRAAEAGLTDMAIIMSDNIFTQLSLQGFTRVVKGMYVLAVFNSESDARMWLDHQTTLSKYNHVSP